MRVKWYILYSCLGENDIELKLLVLPQSENLLKIGIWKSKYYIQHKNSPKIQPNQNTKINQTILLILQCYLSP